MQVRTAVVVHSRSFGPLLNNEGTQTSSWTPLPEAFDVTRECLVSQPVSEPALAEEGFDNRSDTLRDIR